MTAGISACPLVPAALKTLIEESTDADIAGVAVATGPSRKPPNEWIAIGLPRAERPGGQQTFGDWYEEGSVAILCMATIAGAGETCVEAAHDRAWDIATAVAGCFDFCEGGDATLGGIVLECGISGVSDADAALDEIGSSAAHSHVVEVTLRWSARGA